MAPGLLASLALLAMLGLNLALLARHAPRLASALRMAGARGNIVEFIPTGEPNVVMLRPRRNDAVSPAGSALRLAA